MSTKKYSSFAFGVVVTSITWAFSLYLYSKLTLSPNTINPTMLEPDVMKPLEESVFDQKLNGVKEMMLHDNSVLKLSKNSAHDKNLYNVKGPKQKKSYVNSDTLMRHLQPVPVKSSVVLGDGTCPS